MLGSLRQRKSVPYWLLAVLAALALWYVALAIWRPVTPWPSPVAPAPAPRQLKVGIQAGHSLSYDVPDELRALRFNTGALQSNWNEFIVNQQVSDKVAAILRSEGIQVDVLPTTIPPGYEADAFISVHGDGSADRALSGFKVAHAEWSKLPELDDLLVWRLVDEYAAATGLREHRQTITDNMLEYYAFNWRRFRHTVSRTTPAAIVELGFLTNDSDRRLLLEEQDRVASGLARGILRFLREYPPR